MKKKWIRTYTWGGKVYREECKNHSYAWSGKIPCTGVYRCYKCGKPEQDK